MSYLTHPTRHGSVMINLDGIRRVDVIRANPGGGAPRADNGKITYEDGVIMEVTMECALAVQNSFKSKTVPTPKEPKA